jgi:hypothetical protein
VKDQPDGAWRNIPDSVKIKLDKDRNEIVFRAVNLADVKRAGTQNHSIGLIDRYFFINN